MCEKRRNHIAKDACEKKEKNHIAKARVRKNPLLPVSLHTPTPDLSFERAMSKSNQRAASLNRFRDTPKRDLISVMSPDMAHQSKNLSPSRGLVPPQTGRNPNPVTVETQESTQIIQASQPHRDPNMRVDDGQSDVRNLSPTNARDHLSTNSYSNSNSYLTHGPSIFVLAIVPPPQ
ncbi:hypothetical protein K402DRAFT_115430 [Aulographum hederae CBS 113979]|uniref:Uncharacterized protein n=1 Tax=Aulographum hederae CBS 113979 TaxID=1176131 RepID=A0A6G1GVZ8_9PEZI|nr:hypothetical protein K402DRAFT_115430 [Aulographum hederae CBS 113979]